MDVWVYTSRQGVVRIFDVNSRQKARDAQDEDNRCSWEDAREDGAWIDGHPEFGDFSIDDGGSIQKVTVE